MFKLKRVIINTQYDNPVYSPRVNPSQCRIPLSGRYRHSQSTIVLTLDKVLIIDVEETVHFVHS